MKQLKAGSWLGIDVGSARKKVCSFCLIESDGAGNVEVWFEKGSARAPYPEKNSRKDLIDQVTVRPPFMKAPITAAVERVLDESVLVSRCEMRKRGGTCGDLWDAFTCAYVACCEDHGGSALHGEGVDDARLRQEGAILTVGCDRRAEGVD